MTNWFNAFEASRLEVRHLRYFLAVAEEEHFGRGARRVHVAQPAISRQIQQLEEELGVQLFERQRQKVRLTNAGHCFRQKARAILEKLQMAVQETRQMDRSNSTAIRAGYVDMAFYSGVIPERIRFFREKNPKVRVDLVPATSAKQVELLDAGDIDLALIYQEPAAHSPFENCRLWSEPLAVGVHQDHRLAHHSSVALRELCDEPFVWFDRSQNPVFFDYVEQVCGRSGLRRRIVQDGANDPTQLTLVAAQVGITFSPVSASRTKPETVRLIRLQGEPLKLTLYAAWRKSETGSPLLRQLLQTIR